ncbi:MAG: hypothetical protein AAF674_15245 [Pseudomonadota bacterium]
MDDKAEQFLDQALANLAEEVAKASPRPDADLTARVLADAAAVQPPPVADPVSSVENGSGFSLGAWIFGWGGGAVAALSLCLALGVGVGMSGGQSDFIGGDILGGDLLAFGGDSADFAMAADDGLLSDDLL